MRLISDQLHPYQVIVCFADCRCVKPFRWTLESARLGGHLFVCEKRQKDFIRAQKSRFPHPPTPALFLMRHENEHDQETKILINNN